MQKSKVVVVGAGVTGLTTALLLAKKNKYDITLVGRYFPGDQDATYSSPWAGAVIIPVAQTGTQDAEWEKTTWLEFIKLADSVPEAGIVHQNTTLYQRYDHGVPSNRISHAELVARNPWMKNMVIEHIPQKQLPSSIKSALKVKALCLEPQIYLSYLLSSCIQQGVMMRRDTLENLADAASMHHSQTKADLIVNCTGVMASQLNGLGRDGTGDKSVYPNRGQTVLVTNKAPGTLLSNGSDNPNEPTYMLTRPFGGLTLLGGSYQPGNWQSLPDQDLAKRILTRAVEFYPELDTGNGLDIVAHGVGLRPQRDEGPRISSSWVNKVLTVHNYGHGGVGYKVSYGCAADAVKLIEQVLHDSSEVVQEHSQFPRTSKL